jgi:hypothetical protein
LTFVGLGMQCLKNIKPIRLRGGCSFTMKNFLTPQLQPPMD